LRVAGVVFGIGGVAAVGAGVAFGLLAKSYSDSVETGAVFNPNFDERGKLYQNLQWVGYGVGAGLIVTGAVLYTIGAVTGSRASSVAIAPTALPGGAGVLAGGTF
jgi:drug/metabolite transporter (DMT)-like permease